MLRGSQFTWKSSIPSINSRPFWEKKIDPTLQDNVLLPNDFAEHIYHAGSSHRPVWIDSGCENVKKRRRAVFFTAVNRSLISTKKSSTTWRKPRIAVHKKWKVHQNTVYWCDLRITQSKGLQFYQTRSNAIILHNTLPAVCIEKVVNMKSGEEFFSKLYQSPELPQRMYASRICIMDVRILPNLEREHPSTILAVSTGRPVVVESTRRPVAVTLTSESKDGHIQPSNNKMTPSRNQSKSWFIHLKRIQIAKRRKLTWTRIKRSTHSARSRRT